MAQMAARSGAWRGLAFLTVTLAAAALWPACSGPTSSPPNGTDAGPDAGTVIDAGADIDAGDGGDATSDAGLACSPTAQTGCTPPNSKCGLVGNKFGCQAPGSGAVGESCTASASGDSCQAGLFCLNGKCARFCDPAQGASACPSGSSCSSRITWNGGPPNGEIFNACVATGDECDPLAQNCADTSKGCFATNAGNKCLQPGSVADGQTCSTANDCRKGASCYSYSTGGFKCYALCTPATPDGGSADGGAVVPCSAGTCNAVSAGYGICR